MKQSQRFTLGELARLVDGQCRGDADFPIQSVATISQAQRHDLTWVMDEKYARQLSDCKAGAVILPPNVSCDHISSVVCSNPELALAMVLERIQPPPPYPPPGIDPTAILAGDVHLGTGAAIGPRAVIQKNVHIGDRTIIQAGVFIGEDAAIGSDCVIWPNVVIRERCQLGNRVIIHPNSTIGADGFGYNMVDGKFKKIPQIGSVRIEDDVEIGANSCIDRAKCGETVIGRGTKIDNQVQIAHNVQVGPDCCLVAQVGIAGSTTLGHHVMLAGKVGIRDHVTIGDGVQVAACSCVASSIEAGEILLGVPAQPKADYFQEQVAVRRAAKMVQKFRELEKRVQHLEAKNHPKSG